LESLLASGKPLLHCFHNPIDQRQIDFAEQRIQRNTALHFVSENQRSNARICCPSCVIPNPVDTQLYGDSDGTGGYLVFLGRLTFDKGVDVAIDVALQANQKLVIAGTVSKEQGSEEFFQSRIQPHIDGDQIRWVGPLDDPQKNELLSGATALLFPIRWDEPFGIVMVEALASGTPVIATRRASTREVIDHGVTGWLCEPEDPSVDAFVEAVNRLHELDRQDCRRVAEEKFDVRVIAPRVLDVLSKLAHHEPIA
jgi:glycosyltransferase involved in cell wall biosynthesis